MKFGGGRKFWGAAARALAPAVILLLALPALLSPADAQKATDPWWGPSSRSDPTEGWAVRIPVVVENDRKVPLTNLVVAVELDFTRIMLEAGWTSRLAGTTPRLQGFTLDVDSLRVVEYQTHFVGGPLHGAATEPTPHLFFPALFQGGRTVDFEPSSNPAGTVMFVVKDTLNAGQRRYYYVYANPAQYGKHEPPRFRLDERAPLDAYLWGSLGTVHYGYEPQQSQRQNLLHVLNPDAATTPATVTFYQHQLGRFVPVPSTPASPNPLVLDGRNGGSGMFFIPAGNAFKVVSDHPIVVAGKGRSSGSLPSAEAFGFVPSREGSFAGSTFSVFGFRDAVTVIKATDGSGTITVSSGQQAVTLTAARPVARLGIAPGGWSTLRASGGEILVSMDVGDTSRGIHTVPVPATTGGVVGTDFFARVHGEGGFARICAQNATTIRAIDVAEPSRQVFPAGPVQSTKAATILPDVGCHVEKAGSTYPGNEIEFFSTTEIGGVDEPVPFRLTVGTKGRLQSVFERASIGHFGGVGGADYSVEGSIGLFGHYNDTEVVVREARTRGAPVVQTLTLSTDSFLQVQPREPASESTRRYHISATKPISVVSTEGADHPYARYVPGRPVEPKITVGAAEFRGPLLDLRAAETYKTVGPGMPVTFPVDLFNLGRWIGGESLPDRVRVTCSGAPPGWVVSGCDREIPLASQSAERLAVTVVPAADDADARAALRVEARSQHGDVVVGLDLIVRVEVVYGVGMWFDVEGGRKTIDPPVGLGPGETHRYAIVLKNTGSTTDRFVVRHDEGSPGWTHRLELHGEAVGDEIELEAGASRLLHYVVRAPEAETAPPQLVSITAQSVSSALAGDIVNTATRIRPKVDVRLAVDPATRLAAPNQTAVFNLTLLNHGNDIFRVAIREEGALPPGWSSRLDVDEVYLGPGEQFISALRVTPPADALAGELATLKLTAETDAGDGAGSLPGDQASAVVVVRKVHNVTTTGLLEADAQAGERLRYVLPLRNAGNGDETIELLPGASTPAWRIVPDSPTVFLDTGGAAELGVHVDVPAGTPPGDVNLTFTVRLSREATQNLSIPVRVLPTTRVAFLGLDALDLVPGAARVRDVVVANTGNVPGRFVLAADTDDGWNATLEPAEVELSPGERRAVRLTLNATRDTPDGAYVLDLSASASGARAGAQEIRLALARPDLYVDAVESSGRPRAGAVLVVQATIGNRGAAAAENATVALLVDGTAVDAVRLARLPAGGTALATLSWIADGPASDVRVVVDPDETIVEASRDENVAAVAFGSRLPVPGAPLPLTAIGVLALALLRRRQP